MPYDNIMNFVIDEAYEAYDVTPVRCVLTGSRTYGLSVSTSDYDFIGTHLMSTWECLEHPDFRQRLQVVRANYYKSGDELILVEPGKKGGDVSLDSFEIWKFMTLWLKGSSVSYELLHLPAIHEDPNSVELIELMKSGLTSRIGKAAKGNTLHDWRKAKTSRKKTVMAYYRLLQAIYFLREGIFEWSMNTLMDYVSSTNLVETGKNVLELYMNPNDRIKPLTSIEVDAASKELDNLIEEVDRAMIVTQLPDQCPRSILDNVLQKVKKSRSVLI